MTRVTAPSRLHFGLFHVPTTGFTHWSGPDGGPGLPVRAFGGAGLMIDRPGVVVTVRPAGAWQVEGPLASRAQAAALRFVTSLPEPDRRPFQVLVEQCPAEHVGLGVGTSLGLAVARGLAAETSRPEPPAADLARRVGRGERSAVGVHGFDRGGLIVEAGKLPGEDLSPLLARAELPAHWRVVLLTPAGADRWHGIQERQAFAAAAREPRPTTTDVLVRVALLGILPAAVAGDLGAFGEAVYEFNRRAGEPFVAAQGGPYATAEIAELVGELRRLGARGAGQSSWGPTVFAVVGGHDEAVRLVRHFHRRVPGRIARPSAGHRVERVGEESPGRPAGSG
jgi:beta-RFAP synthase